MGKRLKKIEYNIEDTIHSPEAIDSVLTMAVNDANKVGNRKGEYFYNVPCSFDIETSSFYRDADGNVYSYEQIQQIAEPPEFEKCSTMYIWQFGINGYIIVGRTWEQFQTMINRISEVLKLNEKCRLICYVHNLGYEFQFMRSWFEWSKVFSIDLRKPIYAITDNFVEFRCSYLLSGYSLSNLSKQLTRYKCKKLVGALDYHLIRHSQSELTTKEIAYCVNDIRVVMNYLKEKIEDYKGIQRLPITKTGFVRNYCRKQCLSVRGDDGKVKRNWDYINKINELQINNLKEFDSLQRAFAGGFTHANAHYTDDVVTEVESYDFTSSYPYTMVSEQYPMSRGVNIDVTSLEHFNTLIDKYCCVFDIEFTNIFASETQDNPISVSKCFYKEDVADNNGRLLSAGRVVITMTEIDFQVVKNFYTWETMRVANMWCYKRGHLPTPFIESILNLYQDKTQLKGVEGKEVEYLNSKEMLNSCYGMCVTNPLKDEIIYNDDWDIDHLTEAQKEEGLYRYNNSKNRFLFYAWGVYITAYARRNLFTAIKYCGDDYVYSDTDSIKIMNGWRHKEYFDRYNDMVKSKLREVCEIHKLPYSLCEPETIKGDKKPLGVWDYEGHYSRFKTLGAKRYMVEHEEALKTPKGTFDVSLTVSGVNKVYAIPYMVEKFGYDDIFDRFTNYLTLPPEATGKNIHTYVDYQIEGEITDHRGVTAPFLERTGIHLEPTSYSLSLTMMYLQYIKSIH